MLCVLCYFYDFRKNMKLICCILSLYVLVLTSVPCCSDDKCNDGLNTEQTSNNSHQHEGNDHCNGCSPFLTCGTCLGFVYNHVVISFKPYLVIVEEKHISYNSSSVSNFYTEFWQPPKIS